MLCHLLDGARLNFLTPREYLCCMKITCFFLTWLMQIIVAIMMYFFTRKINTDIISF